MDLLPKEDGALVQLWKRGDTGWEVASDRLEAVSFGVCWLGGAEDVSEQVEHSCWIRIALWRSIDKRMGKSERDGSLFPSSLAERDRCDACQKEALHFG